MGRRIIALLMLVLTVVLAAVPSLAATNDSSSMPLDKTTVEEDFKAAGFDADSFSNDGKVVFTTEYLVGGKNYLYVYTYRYYEEYAFFLLKENTSKLYTGEHICSSVDGEFRKYRIDVTDLGYVLEHERVYTILELRGSGEFPITYKVNRSFCFKGSHQKSDISVRVVDDTVLNLTAYSNVYRTSSSPKNDLLEEGLQNCWHNDIFSVYFLVPKQYEDKAQYDYLSAIRYTYTEQMWNAVVTNDSEVLSQMGYGTNDSMELKEFPTYNSEYPSIYINVFRPSPLSALGSAQYNINGHVSPLLQFQGDKLHNKILNIYKDADWANENLYIDLEEKAKEGDVAYFDYTDQRVPSAQYENTIYFDETFTVESYSGKDPNWYDNIYEFLIGIKDEYQVDGTFDPIVKIDDAFFNGYDNDFEKWCGDHLVSKYKAEDFKKLYDENKADHSMYVFRFAQRDYYAAPCVIYETDVLSLPDRNGLYAEGTSFNCFEIISLTYRKDNVDYIVPVDMEAINVNGGITGSTDNFYDGFVSDVAEGLGEKALGVIKIIIAIALLIGLWVILFQWVLPMFWAPKAWQLKTGQNPKQTIKDIEKRYEKEKKP